MRYIMLSPKFVIIGLVLIVFAVGTACGKKDEPVSQTSDTQRDSQLNPLPQEVPVSIDNPDANREMMYKSMWMENLLSRTIGESYTMMYGAGVPESYETLLLDGLLPIIFSNRYTGDDVKNTRDYSPGDIFLSFDADNSILHFYQHMGPEDGFYDPDAVSDGMRRPLGEPARYQTDGKTLFKDDVISSAWLGAFDSSVIRQRFNIPVDNESRAKIDVLYKFMNAVMLDAGIVLAEVPNSLDEYVALFGRRNPAAWLNPYTGGPMIEVPWKDVDMIYYSEPFNDPTFEISRYSMEPVDDPEIEYAGNYSYALGPSPIVEGEMRAYALFYFISPDNGLAAYLAIGLGPEERRQGALGWYEMAIAAGYVPEE